MNTVGSHALIIIDSCHVIDFLKSLPYENSKVKQQVKDPPPLHSPAIWELVSSSVSFTPMAAVMMALAGHGVVADTGDALHSSPATSRTQLTKMQLETQKLALEKLFL